MMTVTRYDAVVHFVHNELGPAMKGAVGSRGIPAISEEQFLDCMTDFCKRNCRFFAQAAKRGDWRFSFYFSTDDAGGLTSFDIAVTWA